MANIFGILTTLVLAVAVFVAFKNKTAYENEIANVITEKDRLGVSQKRLTDAQENLRGINEEIPVVEGRAAELVSEGNQQRSDNESLQNQIATRTAEIDRNRTQINEVKERTAAYGDTEQLAQRMRDLSSELEDLSQAITSNEARLANLTSNITTLEAENTAAQALLEGYSRGESRPGLATRIRSFYPNWGFVTLADGGASGVAGNSTMDVVRGNEVIAKLLVTAVESNTASASIIPGTISDDITLMVGDRVIPGTRLDDND